jgi:nucleoside phosphorylase
MVNPKDYTVGWICAITPEFVAARAFLDEVHKGPDYVSPNDIGGYTLGKIGKHNVVITILPEGEYGISSAASVARDMLHSFPNVRIGLMVGVGGGVPTRHDIRLGDVVVSAPREGHGGIFQYDFGKTKQDQSFRQTGFHNQPPTVLLTACNLLKAQYESEGHQLRDAINSALKKIPTLPEKYQRPDPGSDRLYLPKVVHPNGEVGCAEACGDDPSKLEFRPKRTKVQDPAVHYGLIASANQLMKDALIRDKLAAEKDVLCFEMEAAGLINHFPCLIIRGICDYSDSHKNKDWQGYAAMTAAAYAKDLLSQIAPIAVEVGEFEKRRTKIQKWLKPSDPSTNYNKALLQRHEGSGTWFLQGDAFAKWKTLQNSFLWLYGIPGCGKTILSSTIIENLENTSPPRPVIYFYFDFKDTSKQTLESMVRSLISQLSSKSEQTWQSLVSLHSSYDSGRREPLFESLSKVLLQMIEQVEEVWIILDALDECSTRRGPSKEGLLSWIEELLGSKKRNVHLLVTSRPEQDIESRVKEFARKEDMIPIQSSEVTNDIRVYIHTKLREDERFGRWRKEPHVQEKIEIQLVEKANGM